MLWLLGFPVVLTLKITTEENENLWKKCGARFIGEPSSNDDEPKFLAMGTPVAVNEFPFVAALSIKKPYPFTSFGNFASRYQNFSCTGVQISPRHIMTAAHCVFNYDGYQLGEMCKKTDPERIPMKVLNGDLFTVYVGSTCPPSGSCSPRGTKYKARSVIPHPDFDICKPLNDVAILELDSTILSTDGVPICMPGSNVSLVNTLDSAGFGIDPSFYSNPTAPGLQVVQLTKRHEVNGIIETADKSQSLCRGDSGGPLFQTDEQGRETLVGIASTVEPYCLQFASGVCPLNADRSIGNHQSTINL
ncbi:trypsin [Necator americanus]|uniref:Trypsin n=1 Tax=Necator americanus TaxID=51031 RepID=W2TJ34_NECAM|nr:trypsin [Necator americanus]ETN81609.1 trypsin [Necator americanus]